MAPARRPTPSAATSAALQDKIAFNGGNGVTIASSLNNLVQGDVIGGNLGWGLFAYGDCTGTLVANNTIWINAAGNVNLVNSRGVRYIP